MQQSIIRIGSTRGMMTFSKNKHPRFHLAGAVVLCGWMLVVFLVPSVAGFPRMVEGDGTESHTGPTSEDGEPVPPEDREDPPKPNLKRTNIPDKLKEHDYVYRVEYVLDGDSIRLANGKELRLIGVDAREEGKPFADAARQAVRSIIPEGSIVGVDLDQRWWDRYDRLLGYVYAIHREREEGVRHIFINEMLLERGLARTYLHQRNTTFIERLIEAQKTAIREERGLFEQIVETREQYVRVRGHFRYHHTDCRYVRDIPGKFLITYPTKREALRDGCNAASCLNQ